MAQKWKLHVSFSMFFLQFLCQTTSLFLLVGNKSSISSQFHTRTNGSTKSRNLEIIRATKQTKVDSETSKKLEELKKRIEETKKKLHTVSLPPRLINLEIDFNFFWNSQMILFENFVVAQNFLGEFTRF